MSVKMVLFDLDGTLLPMDQDLFIETYLARLAQTMVPYGYEPKELLKVIYGGTYAMLKNDGSRTNQEAFWQTFTAHYGQQTRTDEAKFEEYYRTVFQDVRHICGYTPQAAQLLALIKSLGLRFALATNPLFPPIATESRIRWAGLEPADFELITTYDNSSYCKPTAPYYLEVCRQLGVTPEECLMVGNDTGDDMSARNLGMQVFLLTDCLINGAEVDINQYPHGGFPELMDYIRNLVSE